MPFSRGSFALSALLFSLILIDAVVAQPAPAVEPLPANRRIIIRPGIAPEQPPTPDPSPEETTDDKPAVKEPPVDPMVVRLHLSDGSIISGKLAIKALEIDTKFGRLSVPIEQIKFVRPGLGSRPSEKEKVTQLIEKLNSTNAADKQAASAELLKLGPVALDLIKDLAAAATGAQATELRGLISRIEERIDNEGLDASDFGTLDVVATTQFTIAGKIVPQSFALDSDFGTLEMALADLLKADRNTGEPEDEQKTITVSQDNFVTRTMKNTGLRVVKGDKIIIRATGQLSMTRWGNAVATPEGASNTGWYLSGKIYNGALCMRIGNSGQITKVGNQLTITATESGLLHLGIAMNPRYAADNFQYPGQFKAIVKVNKK